MTAQCVLVLALVFEYEREAPQTAAVCFGVSREIVSLVAAEFAPRLLLGFAFDVSDGL